MLNNFITYNTSQTPFEFIVAKTNQEIMEYTFSMRLDEI